MRRWLWWVAGCSLSAATAACLHPGGGMFGLKPEEPHAVPRACRSGEPSPWTFPTVVECRAYSGAVRAPDSIAVLATLDRRVETNYGSVTALELTALDGQARPQWLAASESKVRALKWPRAGDEFTHATAAELPCAFVSLLPGDHTVSISVVASAYRHGKSRKKGTARFTAVAGGFYALQACYGPGEQGGEVSFWVRDERSLTCVSDACPRD